MAVKASLAVAKPGMACMPSCSALPITSASQFGATTSVPPASCVRRTCCASSTVPAPIMQPGRRPAASAAMLAYGSGELSGTSMMRQPAWYSASAMPRTRPLSTPRRIATSACSAPGSSVDCIDHLTGCQLSMYLRQPCQRSGTAFECGRGALLCGQPQGVQSRQPRITDQMYVARIAGGRQQSQRAADIARDQQTRQVRGRFLRSQFTAQGARATFEQAVQQLRLRILAASRQGLLEGCAAVQGVSLAIAPYQNAVIAQQR